MLAMLFERYGPRLDAPQLAAALEVRVETLHNKISAGTCPVKTYIDGGRRWADTRDLAAYFDAMREKAA